MIKQQTKIVIAREPSPASAGRGDRSNLISALIATIRLLRFARNDIIYLIIIGYLFTPILAYAQTYSQIAAEDALFALLADKNTINSPTVLVLDTKTGDILAERKANTKRPIASLTKLMTAVIFLEHNPGWNKRVTFKKSDQAIGATVALRPGDVVTTRDLFYAMFVRSANNATRALARSTGLSEKEFVQQMNTRAKVLGMENTSFVEPTGLEEGDQASAFDYAKLAQYALKNKDIIKASTTPKYTLKLLNRRRWLSISNPNKMFKQNRFMITGTKTGYTEEAGRNLLVKAKDKTGQEVLIVTMGANKTGIQWNDMNLILEATLGNGSKQKVASQ